MRKGLVEDCRQARDRRRSGVRLRHVSPWNVVTCRDWQSWRRTFSGGTQQIFVQRGVWEIKTIYHDRRGTFETVAFSRNEAMEIADAAGVRKLWQMPVMATESALDELTAESQRLGLYEKAPSITLAQLQANSRGES